MLTYPRVGKDGEEENKEATRERGLCDFCL